jgi:hypothetical protein
MKKQLKKWIFRLFVTGIFLFALLVTCMLTPVFLYANKTVVGNYSIYHNEPLNKNFLKELQQAAVTIKSSELYDPSLKIDVCLKDGSRYPAVIRLVMGRDFVGSFYNKIIAMGDAVNYNDNYVELDGHKWNLTQMLAHAQVHCLEFKKYGLLGSNPIASHPVWKWEGYPEYIAKQNPDQVDLRKNIERLLQNESADNNGFMKYADGSESLIAFDEYRLLIKYCLEEKKMSFVELMNDTTGENTVRQQMMSWFNGH